MSDLQRKKKTASVGESVAVLSGSKVVTYALSMLVSMLLSRFRTLEEYGTYSQILMIINLFVSLLMLGLPNCINYFLARAETREDRNRFLSVYYIFNTILSFFVGLVLVACVPLFEIYFNNPLISSYTYFIALLPWTKIITSSVENLLIVHGKTRVLVAYRILHSLSIICNIFAVKFLSLGFSEYILIYLICEILFTFIVYYCAIRLDGMFKIIRDIKLIKSILIFSIPLGLSTASGTLKAELDKFVIGYFFSTEQYAVYANAAKEIPVTFIASSITAVLLPIIAKKIKQNKTNQAIVIWNDMTIIGYLINSYFAFALAVFAKEAMCFLYSEKYASGASVFAIYSFVLLFRSTYFGMILQSTGNTKYILKSSLISLIINIVLNIILYYSLGFIGPAVATVVATMWSAFYLLWNTHKIVNKPLKAVFPWRSITLITSVNCVMAIVALIAKRFLHLEYYIGNIAEAILLAVIWAGIYFLLFSKLVKQKMNTVNQPDQPEE